MPNSLRRTRCRCSPVKTTSCGTTSPLKCSVSCQTPPNVVSLVHSTSIPCHPQSLPILPYSLPSTRHSPSTTAISLLRLKKDHPSFLGLANTWCHLGVLTSALLYSQGKAYPGIFSRACCGLQMNSYSWAYSPWI